MQRSHRLERQRLLQREYGKQSSKQGRLEGARCGILVELILLQTCRHWLLSPHALTCVWHSPCPLTCPLLGPLLPLSCWCHGRSLLSHLEQNIWKLEERLSGQGHVHAHVHCGLHNRHFTLRKMAAQMVRRNILYRIGIRCVSWHQCIEITGGREQGSKLP